MPDPGFSLFKFSIEIRSILLEIERHLLVLYLTVHLLHGLFS